MGRRYAYRGGRFVELGEVESPESPGPAIITDSMPSTWHPCDGRYYDSKSRFRQVTKAHACVEVGTDAPTSHSLERLPPVRDDLMRTWHTND